MKAVAARARGDEPMAQHFDADWGRADGLRGEIAALKQDLQLITGTGRAHGPSARPPPIGR